MAQNRWNDRWNDLIREVKSNNIVGEEGFIESARKSLIDSSNIDTWNVIGQIASNISATKGLDYQTTEKIVPLVNATPEQPFSVFFMIAGLKRTDRRSSEFINLANRSATNSGRAVATSCYSMVSVVSEGEYHYREYALSHPAPHTIEHSNIYDYLRLEGGRDRLAKVGDIVVRNRLTNIIVPNEEKSHAVLLSIANHQQSSIFQYSFEKGTGRLKTIADYDAKTSRKLKSIRIIELYGDDTSVPTLRGLMQDEHHVIRWSCIRCMINLDPTNSLSYLEYGLKDENDEIRRVSTDLINKISGEHG